MDSTSPRAKSFKRQVVTIVVTLLLAAAYFAVIVPRKNSYFTNRYFRLLADTGDHLKETVANLGSALVNAPTIPTNTVGAELPEGLLKRAVVEADAGDTQSALPMEVRIRSAVSLVPNLELIEPLVRELGATNTGVRLREVPGSKPSLEFEYIAAADPPLRIRARSDLGRLLQPFMNRGEFDELLLVHTNGEAIYQSGGSPLRVARLDLPADKSSRTNFANSAGNNYLVFTQPVLINLSTRAGGESPGREWILCGLVDTEHFRKQTWGVSYRVLEGFAFVALLLVASWPFLNVWSVGLKGGLRVAEIFLVAFSLLFITALLTFLALDDLAYYSMDQQLKNQSPFLAGRITANLQAELQAVAAQVAEFNQRVTHPNLAVNRSNILSEPLAILPASAPYPWFRGVCWVGTNGQQAIKWTVKDQLTPAIPVGWRNYFRTIAEGRAWKMETGWLTNGFFLEPLFSSNTGENFAAFSTARTADPGVVTEMDFHPLSLMNPVLPEGYGFAVIDPVGQVLFHSDEKRNLRENFFVECANNARLRAAVGGRATDQFNAGYSQRRHNLRVSPLPGLPWSLVVFREIAPLQMAHVEVVSVAGCWFLMYAVGLLFCFGALRFFRGARVARWLWPRRELGAAYRLIAAYNAALLVPGMVVALLDFDPWVTLAAAVLLPGAGLVLTPWALRRNRPAPAWSGIMVLRVRRKTIAWIRLFRGPRWLQDLAGLSRWHDHRYCYVAAFGSLLLLAAFLPTLAFVKLASDTEMELMVKQAQLNLAGDFEARTARVRAEVLGFQKDDGSKNRPLSMALPLEFTARRLSNRWDVYDRFFFGSTITNASRSESRSGINLRRAVFHAWLASLRPHYNPLDVEARGLLSDAADDALWRWQRATSWFGWRTQLTLSKKTSGPQAEGGDRFISIKSDVPHWQFPGLRLAGFALLWSVPFVLVYLVAGKILFLGEDAPKRFDQREWPLGKYLLLGPPHAKKGDWLNQRYFPMLGGAGKPAPIEIDLRKPEGRAWLEEESQDKLFEDTRRPILVEHFEYDLTDPDFNRKKFRFLQQFAADEKRPMIIVSNVHPLNFPVAAAAEPKPGHPPAVAMDKQFRADLLSSFKRIFKEDKDGKSLAALPQDSTAFTAQAHYRSLLATCSPKEQQILHQIADARLVSCRQPEIRTLLGRGLLKLEPDLHLMDDIGLRAFVLSHHRPELDDETKEESSLWRDVKGLAVTVLVLVAAFFFVTERAVWDYTVGVVPAFVAGITALTQIPRIVQMLKSKPSQQE